MPTRIWRIFDIATPDDWRRRFVDRSASILLNAQARFRKIEMELLFSRPPSETVGGENLACFKREFLEEKSRLNERRRRVLLKRSRRIS